MDCTRNIFMADKGIKTESFLEGLVRWLTVYVVTAMGVFLIIKDFLIGDVIVCQPINRGVKVNLSYSQSQASYDKTYCALSMTDFTDNLIIATASEPNTIPGVSVTGIKGEGRLIYQKFFPFALIIQAAFCCIPTLLWRAWASEIIRASVRYIIDFSNNTSTALLVGSSSPSQDSRKPFRLEELRVQVDHWGGGKFLARVYTTKIMLTLGILVFIVCFYLAYPFLNYFNLQALFVCHVHKQTLVTCAFPDIDLIRLMWIVNIVLVDISIVIAVIQLLNVAFCMPRKRTFFSWYLGVEERKTSKIVNDADLISYFCHENLSVMSPRIVYSSLNRRPALHSPLISLSSEEELSSTSSSPSYSTAPQLFRRQSEEKGKE